MNANRRPIPSSSPESLSPIPPKIARSTQSRRSYRRQGTFSRGKAIALESSVQLTINVLLAIIAITSIANLVPYLRARQAKLSTLQESVAQAEEKNAKLRSQFDRNFDPAQASQIMQEQSGRGYPNQKKVIWTKPLD
ncbi:hypothetical protein S7335_2030 [Synechococcus sp. PCC 7335]|uniref:slr1601 family putative cell division protein n=1 Tax=Synechococcus sp. (strain ATCC 29403 / PCC 7335) TaxID=91464 RepID=UPI00017EE460|nr:hypothetical protein [Synechococcus sp. PCC 7335]EDX84333.1 hypothetical protein S7335_2030 [Synechococcus sp. PCC 7335]